MKVTDDKEIELTILMPCLNEAETLGICMKKALSFLANNKIVGEVLIADNGSTDNSISIIEEFIHGQADCRNEIEVRYVCVEEKGYGSALRAGTKAAKGKYIIMGDADDSYDFTNLMPFVEKLRSGYDLVMGNRFKGGIEKGAMPWSHRYIGNPVLSFVGRLFFKSKMGDFHCGLRGYNKESIQKLCLQTTGMEYASEMVVMSELANLKIAEVPTTLKKDGRSRPPHLRSFSDGWRHLKFLLMYSPNWLFLYPGILISMVGVIGSGWILLGDVVIAGVNFSINTLLFFMAFISMGICIIYFNVFTKIYACHSHFIPQNEKNKRIVNYNVNRGIAIGAILLFCGFILGVIAFARWSIQGFGELIPKVFMKISIPAVTLMEVGIQVLFSSFFIGILNIKMKKN